ncbi:MAG: aminotransferase class I/II-fold pyridoxal phosphate-dependent enzyme, partial [Thermodesulfobacteriota bacterium]
MKTFADRVAALKPSATLAITSKAKAMRKEGIDVVNFGAGEPDFDTPNHIKNAAYRAIQEGFTKYTPVGGIDELKDAIIEKFKEKSAIQYKRSEIIVSCGGKHALYCLAQALFQHGDEVIVLAPYWVSYPPIITLAGATPVIVPTRE